MDRYMIISNEFLFIFYPNGTGTRLIAVANLSKKHKKALQHKIVMPKDYSIDTGCFILNADLKYFALDQNQKMEEIGRSKYLFYQFVHNIPSQV